MPGELCVVALLPIALDLGDRVSLPLPSLSGTSRQRSRSHSGWLVQDTYGPTTQLMMARTAAATTDRDLLTGHGTIYGVERQHSTLNIPVYCSTLALLSQTSADNTETRWSFRKI